MGLSWGFTGVGIHMVQVEQPPRLLVGVLVVAADATCTEALSAVLATLLLVVAVPQPWSRFLFRGGNFAVVCYLLP